MTNRTRLEKLEKAIPADGSCPTCGHRRLDPMADAAAIATMRAAAEKAMNRALLATGGDREAALALVREHAPTLSEYLP